MSKLAVRADGITQTLLRQRNVDSRAATKVYRELLGIADAATEEIDQTTTNDCLATVSRILLSFNAEPDELTATPPQV